MTRTLALITMGACIIVGECGVADSKMPVKDTGPVRASRSEKIVQIDNGLVKARFIVSNNDIKQQYCASKDGKWVLVAESFRPPRPFPGKGNVLYDSSIDKTHRLIVTEALNSIRVAEKSKTRCNVVLAGQVGEHEFRQVVTLCRGQDFVRIEVSAEIGGSPTRLEYLLLPFVFNVNKPPVFVHTPHIKGPTFDSEDASDQIISDRVFYSPAVILQEGGLFCALVPDLDMINKYKVLSPDARRTRKTGNVFATPIEEDKYSMPTGLDLNVKSGLTSKPLFSYGFIDSIPTHHMHWPHPSDGSMVRTLKSGSIRYGFDLFVAAEAPGNRGYQRISRYLWARYGSPTFGKPRPQAMPFAEYAKVIYPASIVFKGGNWGWGNDAPPEFEEMEGWVQFEMNGQTVGGWRNCAPMWYDVLSNSPWWNNARDSVGMYFWGKRLKDVSLVEKARMIINLAMQAPQKQGIFPTIYRAQRKKWVASHWDVPAEFRPDFLPEGFKVREDATTYHTISCTITATHLLRYNRLCEEDRRIVRYCKRYADFMLRHLDERGTMPAWITKDLVPSNVLRESGEGGAHMWFFAELYRATKDKRYLDAAQRIANYVISEVLPRQRWRDIEVHFSCGKKPLNFFDDIQGQDARGTLPMIWAAGGFAALYEIAGNNKYLNAGEQAIDYGALYQTCWDPHFIYTAYSFGGWDTDNGDAAWMNAHSAWTVGPLLWYGKELARQDLLERAVAAAKSSVTVINHPRLMKNNIYRFPNYPYGLGGENICHEGFEQSCGRTSPGCGEQSGASAGLADALRDLGGAYVNVGENLAVGVDGVRIAGFEFDDRSLRVNIENHLGALPMPYDKPFEIDLKVEGLPDEGPYTLIVNEGEPIEVTAKQLASHNLTIQPEELQKSVRVRRQTKL